MLNNGKMVLAMAKGTNKKIILGSASRWRQQILREAGFEFEIMAANIDERKIRFSDPEKLTVEIAKAKA